MYNWKTRSINTKTMSLGQIQQDRDIKILIVVLQDRESETRQKGWYSEGDWNSMLCSRGHNNNIIPRPCHIFSGQRTT